MHQKELDRIIREYLSGKDTPEGKKLFDAWYASHHDETSPLEGLSEAEKEKIRQTIFAKAKAAPPAQPHKTPNLPKQTNRKKPLPRFRMAAVWVVLLISIASLFYVGYHPETTLIQTAYGEITRVTLPDGSEATLNAHSTLRYASDWEEHTTREVWLEGEAFFSVVHTSDERKFQVHTSHLNVEVLGTEFNVNSRQDDTEVVLHSGKVKLAIDDHKAAPEVVMVAGELVAYSETRRRITKKTVDPQRYTYWRNQELFLDNTSLADIARALEDYYGFEVVFQDEELKNSKITATAKLSLKDTEVILSAISEIYGVKLIKDDHRIVFSQQ